jgi:peptidoglycan/LPS O-acetylase OafA/YrhL
MPARQDRVPSSSLEGVDMSLKYRPEIDGLRTISVCAVLIYHAKFVIGGFDVLPGGFLGVDVFFVISGFLITTLIVQEHDRTGQFSIANFYERRARRLLPALFLVIFASFPVAWAVLMPSQMIDYVNSLLASVFFVSNMYWYTSVTQYGAEPGLVKPFLHTWSLAVEEQFYIFFPLVYVAALRLARRAVPALLAALIVGGLAFADRMTHVDRDLSFYWLLSRLWELGAGALLAHMLHEKPGFLRTPFLRKVMPSVGIALIVGLMFSEAAEWRHPGLTTVPAVLGATLVIWFGGAGDPGTRLLASRGFVAIGLISYSLYLWHYPIYAFGRLINPVPGVLDKTVWIVLSFALAWFSWRVVERAFRAKGRVGRPMLIVASLGGAGIVCGFAALMVVQDGRPQRLEALAAIYGPAEYDTDKLRAATWDRINAMAQAQGLGPSDAHSPSVFEAERLWFDMDRPGRKVLVLGNSLGRDMWNTMALDPALFPDVQFARFGMRAGFPSDQVRQLLASPNLKAADTVLVTFSYTPNSIKNIARLLDPLQATGKMVIIGLNSPEFKMVEGRYPFDWYVRHHGGMASREELNRLAYRQVDRESAKDEDDALRAEAARRGMPIFDRYRYLCFDDMKICDYVTEDGRKTISDHHHYTVLGAKRFGARIKQQGSLIFL